MTDGFVKLAAACPDTKVGDVEYNLVSCIEEVKKYASLSAQIIAFPELTLTGATVGDMFFNAALLRAAEDALSRFVKATKGIDAMIFIGVPVLVHGVLYNCAAAVFNGELKGLIPSLLEDRHFKKAPDGICTVNFAGVDTVFGIGQLFFANETSYRIGVRVGKCSTGCRIGENIRVILASEPEGVGVSSDRVLSIREEAKRECCAVIYANSGEGESGSECVYSGHSVIADALGNFVCREPFLNKDLVLVADTEATDFLKRKSEGSDYKNPDNIIKFNFAKKKTELPRFSKTPFVPEDEVERREACKLAFEIQSRGLAGRVKRSHSKTMVLGISGGLDSTLALLAAARAADILGKDGGGRASVSAVTMPCFGTTARTKGNAERLAELLGAKVACIDIKNAVAVHFDDIGHDAENYNVVYENAQARERTQVLMDIANAEGGLVIGTGDLSEAALGWATYNGDHMSMYGVNASIPKTLVRAIVENYAKECGDREIAEVLYDILATPVSPELLPPKDGEIAQCTEGIVGPYELHDFFIYHFVREGTSPDKLLRMARSAFDGVYDEKTVEGWCRVFLRRFATQQFKRSCTPDAPSVGIVSLSPRGAWMMPSDISPAVTDF